VFVLSFLWLRQHYLIESLDRSRHSVTTARFLDTIREKKFRNYDFSSKFVGFRDRETCLLPSQTNINDRCIRTKC
jgi:hypothetical protein